MDQITRYFEGEKLQCTFGLFLSLILICCSIYFLYLQRPILKGVAYSSLPILIFLLIVCIGIVIRTSNDIQRVTTIYQKDIGKIQVEEFARMEKVMKSFKLIKKVEIAIFFLGLILATIFWRQDLIKGIALGLILQGVIMYLFDDVAESRGEVYWEFLHSL